MVRRWCRGYASQPRLVLRRADPCQVGGEAAVLGVIQPTRVNRGFTASVSATIVDACSGPGPGPTMAIGRVNRIASAGVIACRAVPFTHFDLLTGQAAEIPQ